MKKLITILLVFAMSLSLLAGCGGSDSASNKDNTNTNTNSDVENNQQEEERGEVTVSYNVTDYATGDTLTCELTYDSSLISKEEEIFDDAIDSLNRLRESGIPEDEVIKKLFEHIFKIYSEKIEEYSFKTEKLNLKISLSMLEHLDDVPGDSKSEKFRTLMREYLHK